MAASEPRQRTASGGNSTQHRSVCANGRPEPLADAAVIRRGVMRISRRLRGERPAGGVTIGKLNILGHLQSAGALTAGDLATHERAQPQTLTRLLAEMERDGLITREQDPTDRRRTIVRITSAGAATLVRDMRERDVWLASAMQSTLTPVERDLLRLAAGLLDRLA